MWEVYQRRGLLPILGGEWIGTFVFDEVVTYFNRIGHHAKAVTVGDMLLHSPSVRLIHVDESLLYDGWAYFQQYWVTGRACAPFCRRGEWSVVALSRVGGRLTLALGGARIKRISDD